MGYWYLATPYSKHPGGVEEAADEACAVAAHLMREGLSIFSPIAHSHAVAIGGGLDLTDHDFWMPLDRPLFDGACGVIVAMMEGWEDSVGVAAEIEWAKRDGKPILYVDCEGVV